MINRMASTITVDHRVQCLTNCTASPICDSYNYRPSDKTWSHPMCCRHFQSQLIVSVHLSTRYWTQGPTAAVYPQHLPARLVWWSSHPSDKTCELNTHGTPLEASSTDIVVDNDWTWWSPNFCNVV